MTDQQQRAVLAASAPMRALSVVAAGLRHAWPRSLASRIWLKVIPASADGGRQAILHQSAALVSVAAASAMVIARLGTRRDGLEWVVPAGAFVIAVFVMLATRPAKDSR